MSESQSVHQIIEESDSIKSIGQIKEILRRLRTPLPAKHLTQTSRICQIRKYKRNALTNTISKAVPYIPVPPEKPYAECNSHIEEKYKIVVLRQKSQICYHCHRNKALKHGKLCLVLSHRMYMQDAAQKYEHCQHLVHSDKHHSTDGSAA